MDDKRIIGAVSTADLEYGIREVHSERGFDFSEAEWDAIKRAGYDKLDIAKLCCEMAVMAEVECYDRRLIVAWDAGPSEEDVLKVLERRYCEWVHLDDHPEAENYCCEEWMLDGLSEVGQFDFFVIYDEDPEDE